MYGIYLICRFLQVMWPESTTLRGCVQVRCDNLAGVYDCSTHGLKSKQSKKFRGLLRAIRKNILGLRTRGLIINIQHIKGHQDDLQQFDQLSRWAQLNIIADQAAKKRLGEFLMHNSEICSSSFHGEGWSCWTGPIKCEDFGNKILHKWIFHMKARQYWSFKGILSFAQFDMIDWDLIARVMATKPHLF